MIGRLNHVAIAVPDLEVALAMYRDALGATVTEPKDLPEHGVTVVFVELDNSKIELRNRWAGCRRLNPSSIRIHLVVCIMFALRCRTFTPLGTN